MPLAHAQRRCPGAVFLPSDHAVYDAASAEVLSVLRSFGYPVELWAGTTQCSVRILIIRRRARAR